MKIKSFLPMIFLILTLLFPYSSVAAQASQASIGFEPRQVHVSLDAISEVAVNIQDVNGLYAYDILINYDPGYLEVMDADTQSADIQISQGSFLESGLVVINSVDTQAGTIKLVTTQLSPSEAKSGSGNLLILRLKGKKEGSTQIKVTAAQLSSRDGEPIPATLSTSEVTISATAADAVVPTPFDVVQPTVSVGTEVEQPAADSTLSPTAEGPASTSETPQPQAFDLQQLFGSGNLLCFGSTIIELGIVIFLVIFLRNKMKQKGKKKNG
ncbi:MAG: cohesin domain-containing protein [Chloroflexota bacterium]